MKSLKTKIILLVVFGIVISSLAIGVTSIISSYRVVGNNSTQIMNLLCDNKMKDINLQFTNVENSVETLAVYAQQQLKDVRKFQEDADYVTSYTKSMVKVAVNSAVNTQGAMSVYIRYNTAFTKPTSGLFYMLDETSKTYKKTSTTDLSKYDEDDDEHVGWYYQPYKAHKGVWLAPYLNRNIEKKIISYVKPIYINGVFIGVVGMDIDFTTLQNSVKETSIYDSGYAFLTDADANIIYHPQIKEETDLTNYNDGEFLTMAEGLKNDNDEADDLISYSYLGDQKNASYRVLKNNMRLVLCAPTSEIDEQANRLLLHMGLILVFVIIVLVFVTIIFTKRLVRPLLELTEAAKRITAGDLSVQINHRSKDEVGILAESFRQCVVYLERYFSYISKLAFRDSLTGAQNKTAYMEMVNDLDYTIQAGKGKFGVIVFDLNDLKYINDTYGHSFGDKKLVEVGRVICEVFKDCLIYRVGGDEFVAILQGSKNSQVEMLLKQFDDAIQQLNEDPDTMIVIQVAKGYSLFTYETDQSFEDVFRRADKIMYRNKMDLKTKGLPD